jgi:uncharacterized membrane protein
MTRTFRGERSRQTRLSRFIITRHYLYIHAFAFLWVLAFVVGSSRFILVSSAAIWYFNRETTKSANPIMTSIKWLLRYHPGSIAFGSLLLALVWLLQIIAEYVAVDNIYARRSYEDRRASTARRTVWLDV